MATRPTAKRPTGPADIDPELVSDDPIADTENTGESDLPPAEGTVVTPSPPEVAPPKRAPSALRSTTDKTPFDGFTDRTTQPASGSPRRPSPRPPSLANATSDIEAPEGDSGATRILASDALQAPARFELVVTEGRSRGTRFPLRPGVHTIGRSSQCDCSVLDEAVSRRHFELRVDKDGVLMRDLGSGNGTVVNGDRIDELQLAHGDQIQVGDTVLEVRERGKAPVSARPAGDAKGGRAKPRSPADAAANRRKILLAATAVGALLALAAGLGHVRAKQDAIRVATAHFQRGRQDLEQGDADAALDELQQALAAYPDPDSVQEKIALARLISDGQKQLAKARDLADQRDFDGARKTLETLPHNDILDAQAKDARADIDKREADWKAAQAAKQQAGQPVDPTTLAEAKEYWKRGKAEAHSNFEAAMSDLGHAYDELASRGAGGADFDAIRADYLALLNDVYQRYRRSNRARAAIAFERANAIEPNAISEADLAGETRKPPPVTTATPVEHHHKHHPAPHHASHAPLPRRGGAAAPSKAGGGGRFDEKRAEELCDEADALLGQDPDAAKRKYQQALKVAPPGGDAARAAQQALSQ
ncbi:MAG: FHA domain-containing protein [Deltaproteobacteria bacterium]